MNENEANTFENRILAKNKLVSLVKSIIIIWMLPRFQFGSKYYMNEVTFFL